MRGGGKVQVDWKGFWFFVSVQYSLWLGLIYLSSFCTSIFNVCFYFWALSSDAVFVSVSLHTRWAFNTFTLVLLLSSPASLFSGNPSILLQINFQHPCNSVILFLLPFGFAIASLFWYTLVICNTILYTIELFNGNKFVESFNLSDLEVGVFWCCVPVEGSIGGGAEAHGYWMAIGETLWGMWVEYSAISVAFSRGFAAGLRGMWMVSVPYRLWSELNWISITKRMRWWITCLAMNLQKLRLPCGTWVRPDICKIFWSGVQ